MNDIKLNIFTAVKQSVTPRQAASFYGLNPLRNGMCRCPFHDDRTPSMKLYDDHFYCFGCGASGDVVDLAGDLLHLSPIKTVERLCEDFGIRLQDAAGPYSPSEEDGPTGKPSGRFKGHMPRDQPGTPSCHVGTLHTDDPSSARYSLRKRVNTAVKTLCAFLRVMEKLMAEHEPDSPEDEWDDVFAFAVEQHARARVLLDHLLACDCEGQETFLNEQRAELEIFNLYTCRYGRRKEDPI